MADWNQPTLTSLYADFLSYLSARDVDAVTLGVGTLTNPPVGSIRFDRPGNKFQEWNGSAWVDKILAIAGGGTGSATGVSLGTIASQNANNVAITGGAISGLNSFGVNGSAAVNTNLTVGGLTSLAGPLNTVAGQILNAAGKIVAIDSARFSDLSGANLTGLTAGQIPSLDASKTTTGIFNTARLGSGTASATTVLKGDGTWGAVGMVRRIVYLNVAYNIPSNPPVSIDVGLPVALDNYTFAALAYVGNMANFVAVALISNSTLRITTTGGSNNAFVMNGTFCITEYKNVGP